MGDALSLAMQPETCYIRGTVSNLGVSSAATSPWGSFSAWCCQLRKGEKRTQALLRERARTRAALTPPGLQHSSQWVLPAWQPRALLYAPLPGSCLSPFSSVSAVPASPPPSLAHDSPSNVT